MDKNKKNIDRISIKLNEFGELERNINIDDINAFLNETVEDRKINTSEEE